MLSSIHIHTQLSGCGDNREHPITPIHRGGYPTLTDDNVDTGGLSTGIGMPHAPFCLCPYAHGCCMPPKQFSGGNQQKK